MSVVTFNTYIQKITKDKNKDLGLSSDVKIALSKIIDGLASEISRKCCKKYSKISAWEIQYTIAKCLPRSLYKFAVQDGTEATTDFLHNTEGNKAKRSGLVIPPYCADKYLKKYNDNNKFDKTASVYLAAILEYLMTEILIISGNYAREHNDKRITKKHFDYILNNDKDICEMIVMNDIEI